MTAKVIIKKSEAIKSRVELVVANYSDAGVIAIPRVTVVIKDFPGHKGRPGKVGGSLPRGVTVSLSPKTKKLPEDGWLKKKDKIISILTSLKEEMPWTIGTAVSSIGQGIYNNKNSGDQITVYDNDYNSYDLTLEQAQDIKRELDILHEERIKQVKEQLYIADEDILKIFDRDFENFTHEDKVQMWSELSNYVMEHLWDENADLTKTSRHELEYELIEFLDKELDKRYPKSEDYEKARFEMNNMIQYLSSDLANAHKNRILGYISEGRYTPKYIESLNLGLYDVLSPNGYPWEELSPDKPLYHVATSTSSILENGLKTRYELADVKNPRKEESGLGGGDNNVISFTDNIEIAKQIEQSLIEYNLVLNRKISCRDLVECAIAGGGGASKPWYKELYCMVRNIGGEPKEDSDFMVKDLREYADFLDSAYTEQVNNPDKTYESYSDPFHKISDFYTLKYLYGRELGGGWINPVIMGKPEALRDKNPSEIKMLTFTPQQYSMGYRVGGLSEIRTFSGKAVNADPEISNNFDYTVPKKVMGL